MQDQLVFPAFHSLDGHEEHYIRLSGVYLNTVTLVLSCSVFTYSMLRIDNFDSFDVRWWHIIRQIERENPSCFSSQTAKVCQTVTVCWRLYSFWGVNFLLWWNWKFQICCDGVSFTLNPSIHTHSQPLSLKDMLLCYDWCDTSIMIDLHEWRRKGFVLLHFDVFFAGLQQNGASPINVNVRPLTVLKVSPTWFHWMLKPSTEMSFR